jgi:hypothetical protein
MRPASVLELRSIGFKAAVGRLGLLAFNIAGGVSANGGPDKNS